MTLYIGLFLLIGTCFGLLSFSNRHLFSEGPSQAPAAGTGSRWSGWLFWLALCTLLWPIMLLTGLNTLWVLAKRRRRSDPGADPR
ncbi:MAG: hypothetical protein RLZZ153_1622 [Pseudomonadota bacterium]|jgi:hypothetical protein